MPEQVKETPVKATAETEEKELSATEQWQLVSLHRCKEIIAKASDFSYGDLSNMFNEARIDDARYYARRFHDASNSRLMGNTFSVLFPIMTAMGLAPSGPGGFALLAAAACFGVAVQSHFSARKEHRQTMKQLQTELSRCPGPTQS